MTSDNPSVAPELDSAVFGAMIGTTGVIALSVSFDVCGVQIFESSEEATTYVDARRLRLPMLIERAIQEWPRDPDSIFEFTRQLRITNSAFRPRQLMDETAYARTRIFAAIELHAPVVDCFCLTFHLHGPAWGMIACLRCRDSAPFTAGEVQLLEAIKPGAARMIGDSLDRPAPTRPHVPDEAGESPLRRRQDPADILARLSRTERQVLQFLYTPVTERQIAQSIHRSPHTVHVHVKNIYRKLGVNSRGQLQTLARR